MSGAQHTAQWAIRRALIPSKAPSELADVLHRSASGELSRHEAARCVQTDDEHSQRCVLGSAVCVRPDCELPGSERPSLEDPAVVVRPHFASKSWSGVAP